MSNSDTMTVSDMSSVELTTEASSEIVAEGESPKDHTPKATKPADTAGVKTEPARSAPARGGSSSNIYALIKTTAKKKEAELAAKVAERQKAKEQAAATTPKSAETAKPKRLLQMPSLIRMPTPPASRSAPLAASEAVTAKPSAPSGENPLDAQPVSLARSDDVAKEATIASAPVSVLTEKSEQAPRPSPVIAPAEVMAEPATPVGAPAQPEAPPTSTPPTPPPATKPMVTTLETTKLSSTDTPAAQVSEKPAPASTVNLPTALTTPTAAAKAQPSQSPPSSKAPASRSSTSATSKGVTPEEPLRLTKAELDRLLDEAAEGGEAAPHTTRKPASPKAATPASAAKPTTTAFTRGGAAVIAGRRERTDQPSIKGGTHSGKSSPMPARHDRRGDQSGGRPPLESPPRRDRNVSQQPVAARGGAQQSNANAQPSRERQREGFARGDGRRENHPRVDGQRQGQRSNHSRGDGQRESPPRGDSQREGQRDSSPRGDSHPRGEGQRGSPSSQTRVTRGARDNAQGRELLPTVGLPIVLPSPSTRGRKPNDAKPARATLADEERRRSARAHGRANIRPTKLVTKPAPLPAAAKLATLPLPPSGPVLLPAVITVRELAPLLRTTTGEMIKKLIELKIFATINQSLSYDTASLIAEELGIETKAMEEEKAKPEAPAILARTTVTEADQGKLQPRPPVVTILGHVDHGKTSLLDAIRSTNVAAGEAGGITQHIGAYQVEKQGRKITFLDTPGHAAFTAMRARGAQVTDVAVLVVAADDGVMPQTKEAINHARAANVPIVVALNKIDRETAEPQRVIRQLADMDVIVEEWGGDTPMVKVSAKKLTGIDELLEMILLVTDLSELKANPERTALGTVIEAEMDRSRGPIATLLVQQGTLRAGDYIVIDDIYGRVRAMFNERDQKLEEAGPSTPVVVLGLPSVPQAGDTFKVVEDERTARALADKAAEAQAQPTGRAVKALSLDDLYTQMQAGKVKELNIVLKADVQGSIEPIRNSLEKLSAEELRVRILHEATGAISESDVSLALASDAIVIGFHVEPDPAAERLARNEGVDIRTYNIIYNLIEDVEKALKGLLEPKYKEVITGHAEVRVTLKVSKRNVAGSYVTDGKASRSGQARVLRAGKLVYDGRVASLKRFTEDVREVATNFECGLMLEGFEDVKQGDIVEFYHKEKEE